MKRLVAVFACVCAVGSARAFGADASEIKVGIIGCDTSHTLAFAKILNVQKPDYAASFRVTVAHKWGSRDIVSSTNRYEKYLAELQGMGVEMCGTVDELLAKADVVCLETNDGREHLWQAEKCFKAKKRVFIDKPIAQDYVHAKAIYDLGRKYDARYFSTSALRYPDAQQDCRSGKYGRITGCEYFAPSPIEAQGTHSRYVWYGIHGFESVFTVMGRGVASVRSLTTPEVDVVVMKWTDGRIATLRANQKSWNYGGFAFPEKGKPVALGGYEGYEKMLRQICVFFRTGEVPVPNEETLELFAVMDAAARSAAEDGREVLLSEICGQSAPDSSSQTLLDTCWMWGHETGQVDGPNNSWGLAPATNAYSMVQACRDMGLYNLNVIRWDLPDRAFRDSLRGLRRLTFPISAHPDEKHSTYAELGDYDFAAADEMPNVVGFELDDYLLDQQKRPIVFADTPEGRIRVQPTAFPYADLVALRKRRDAYPRPLELRVVFYDMLFRYCEGDVSRLKPFVDLSTVVTYWTWKAKDIPLLPENFARYRKLAPDKPTYLGIYLYDFGGKGEMPMDMMELQLKIGLEMWRRHEIEGFVFLCSSICNRDLPPVRYARAWIREHGCERRTVSAKRTCE